MTPFQEWWASLPPNEGFRDEEHLAELAWAAATAAERERASKVCDAEAERLMDWASACIEIRDALPLQQCSHTASSLSRAIRSPE